MTEAEHPPVRRWGELPEDESELARRGFEAWQAGELDDAYEYLSLLREHAANGGTRDALFHAVHLLAVVEFDRQDPATARTLHEEVLTMCHAIGFLGGTGSTLFDLAMIDRSEGDTVVALRRFEEARVAFAKGGYSDRLALVDRAIASLRGA